jgi:hypothetical protein
MKAACEAAPYIHAKLAVVATISGGDYADRLELAIKNGRPKMIEAKPAQQAEHTEVEEPQSEPTPASRSFMK